ncbi:uncharacterized protein [Ptychodera flava]|uniref:uncharacterized protein n=1 Tax=Ptychodera flava TaxID=63121 RepID=UPI00396A1FE7
MEEAVVFAFLFSLSLLHFTVQQPTVDRTTHCFDSRSRCADDERRCSYTFVLPKPGGDTCPTVQDTVRDMSHLQTENEGLIATTVDLQDQVSELQRENSDIRKELAEISVQAGNGQTINNTVVYSRDGCLSSPCRYGGTCVEVGDGYRCLCRNGRSGNDCIIPPGKVTCWRGDMYLQCNSDKVTLLDGIAACCPHCQYQSQARKTRFTGIQYCFCDKEDTDECLSSPCQNGGTCQDLLSSYKCNCPDGYSGTNCETNIQNPVIPGESICSGLTTYTCEQSSVCPYEETVGQECVHGVCECPHPDYTKCSCLPNVTTCIIEESQNHADFISVPRHNDYLANPIYCCHANNDKYNVIVIAERYPDSQSPETTVTIDGTGDGKDIILVFSSFAPVVWNVTLSDPGVSVAKAILVSKYIENSDVNVLVVEIRSFEGLNHDVYGCGNDRGGDNTVGLLKYLHQRFGPITSFIGTPLADDWIINLDRI